MVDDLDEDIRDHITRETEDNIARGMSPEDARSAALRAFGDVMRVKEETRAVWISVWLEQLGQDVRFALRLLRTTPAFTIAAVKEKSTFQSYPDYLDLRDRNRSFDGLAAFGVAPVGLDVAGHPTRACFLPIVDQEQLDRQNSLNARGNRWISWVVGHLKPDVTPSQAVADLDAIGADLNKRFPEDDGQMTFALARPALGLSKISQASFWRCAPWVCSPRGFQRSARWRSTR